MSGLVRWALSLHRFQRLIDPSSGSRLRTSPAFRANKPEFAAQLLTPGIGFTKFPKVPGVAEPGPMIQPPKAPPRDVVGEAAERLQPLGVKTPSAVTGGPVQQRVGQYVSNVPLAGAPVADAVHALPGQLESARDIVAAEHGAGSGPNVAGRAGQVLSDAAKAETQATTAAAEQADAQALADWQRAQAGREAAIAERERQSTQATQQAVGGAGDPLDMGSTVIGAVRAGHNAAETNKNNLYARAAAIDGTVSDAAVGNADRHVAADLQTEYGPNDRTVTITPNLTPAALDMRQSMEAFSQRARQRQAQAQAEAIDGGGTAADADTTGINLRTLETQRQELLNLEQGAKTPVDRRAARRIMSAFDDWHEAAMQSHFDGDPGALQAYRDARAANRDFRRKVWLQQSR